MYWPAGPYTCDAVTFVNVAEPPTCSCTTNVPMLVIVAFEMATPEIFEPETNWIAS